MESNDLSFIEDMIKNRNKEERFVSAKKTLDWFVQHMGSDNWIERKKGVVKYFKDQEPSWFTNDERKKLTMEDERSRVSYHLDWIAWYLYLLESVYLRPFVDEPSQSARIFPIFSAIGRYITIAKRIIGIDKKLDELLKGNDNKKIDSLLFEIVVALMYRRNGWHVEFIPEGLGASTPDLIVTRGQEKFYVECKRLAKSTDYSSEERKQWRMRWDKLSSVLHKSKLAVSIAVTFKTEISATSEDVLLKAFSKISNRLVNSKEVCMEDEQLVLTAKKIDIAHINTRLKKDYFRWNSPALMELISGEFDGSENYSHCYEVAEYCKLGDDPDDILNIFCGKIWYVNCAKWHCINDISLDKKAKDVRNLLRKATDQAPINQPTIIHLGYETLHGPKVESIRAEKISSLISSFDFRNKEISTVFCHALNPTCNADGNEYAETTTRFNVAISDSKIILQNELLLIEPDSIITSGTHWDIIKSSEANESPL